MDIEEIKKEHNYMLDSYSKQLKTYQDENGCDDYPDYMMYTIKLIEFYRGTLTILNRIENGVFK